MKGTTMKRIALALAALALPFVLAAPAQAAPVPAHHTNCVYTGGAFICQGTYLGDRKPFLRPTAEQVAQIRANNLRLIRERIAARQAILLAR